MSLFSAARYSLARLLSRPIRKIKATSPVPNGGYLKSLRFHSSRTSQFEASGRTTTTTHKKSTVSREKLYSPFYNEPPPVQQPFNDDVAIDDSGSPYIPLGEQRRLVELLDKLGYQSPAELLRTRKVLPLIIDYESTPEFSAANRYEALASDELLLLLKYFYNRPCSVFPTATVQLLGDILLTREETEIPIFSIYIMHIFSKLFYHHIPLLQKCSSAVANSADLSTLLVARKSMLVLACSSLKWLDEALMDRLATLVHPGGSFDDFVHYFLCALAKLNYLPVGEHALLEMLNSESYIQEILTRLNRSRLLNLCWSLCVLNLQPNLLLNRVLNPNFVESLLDGLPPEILKVNLSRFRQINTCAYLEHPYYTGPFLKLSPQWAHLVDAPHQVPPMQAEVTQSLVNFLGDERSLSINSHTPYGYVLDAEMLLDKNGTALPPDDFRSLYSNNKEKPAPPPNSKRVAVVVQNFSHYTSVKKHLLGKHAMKKRHLKLLGYGIIEVPFFEWQKLSEKDTRIAILEEKMKRALEST